MSTKLSKLLVGALVVIGVVVSGGGVAQAATNQGPNPDDFSESTRYGNDWSGHARRIDYVVATTNTNYIPTTRVKIYMTSPNGTIVIRNKNICYNTFRNGGDNFDLPDNGTLNGSSGNVVSYSISGFPTVWGQWDGSSSCDNKTTSIAVSGASLDISTGMYLYVLNAQAHPAATRYMHTFWITAPSGAIISQDSTLSATSGFGMNQADPITLGNNPSNTQYPPSPYRNYSNWNMKFAPDCTVTTPTVTRTIEMYDDDNRAASQSDNWAVQPRRFSVAVRELTRPGVVQGYMNLSGAISFPDGSGGSVNRGNGFHEVWTSGSNKRIHLTLTFKRDMKYQFILNDVYQDNTMQFKLPFDNVYYHQECQTNNFNLQPNVNVTITDPGGAVVPGIVAEPGDTITFRYAVNNVGSTGSETANCNVYGRSYSGYNVTLVPPDSSSDPGYTPPALDCPRTFPTGNTTLVPDEVVVTGAAEANTTICRTLAVDPSVPGGGTAATKSCAVVASKPYARVYGGDILAGSGWESAPGLCTLNSDASVVGWNRRSAGSYAGAGAQLAIFALAAINDFSGTLGNGAGSAPPPDGLSFGNTATDPSNGDFGGSFGSLPCIKDYYGTPTSNPLPSGDLSSAAVVSGEYTATGPVSLRGVMSSSKQVTVYVDGDVIIDGNIGFPASWTASTTPRVQIIARGNIFIGSGVTSIDGIFVAQPTSSSDGIIYTCASTASPPTPLPLSGNLYSTCSNKLTINGAFIAREVHLLRTFGSLLQSSASESSGASNAGEEFNFGPALWMLQPAPSDGSTSDYDAIVSLPPIL